MKVRVFVGKSRIAGQGLFTLQNIKKDTRVIPYVGERINKAQSAKRLAQGNAYIFTFSDQYDIDGKVLSNTARYINHSCDPNCESDEIRGRVIIRAIRKIAPGEELSYDYCLYDGDPGDPALCHCGAKNCRGSMYSEKEIRERRTLAKKGKPRA